MLGLTMMSKQIRPVSQMKYLDSDIIGGPCRYSGNTFGQIYSPWLGNIVDSSIGLSYRPASLHVGVEDPLRFQHKWWPLLVHQDLRSMEVPSSNLPSATAPSHRVLSKHILYTIWICSLSVLNALFRIQIRIHRIHMFLDFPDPDLSVIKQK